jgi:aldehyde dehydrogenase (NAD(P)+)
MSIQQEQPLQSTDGIDAALSDLAAGESAWAETPVTERRRLLEQVHALVGENAQAWVDAACQVKQLPKDSPLVGEEWLSGPYGTLQSLSVLIESLKQLERGGSPIDGYKLTSAPGGRVVVHGLPHTAYEQLLMSGFTAEVWMPPGVDEATVKARAGLAERDPKNTGGVGVVLGAGNIMSIPPLDVLYELYAENRVVALKLNPITDAMLPVFTTILTPLIELGVVRILTGGADVGGYLVHHPDVKHVHMTGSAITHDAIVWGHGEEAARRKAEHEPQLDKEITSELGGVSPIIVIPGPWSKADLKFQAEHVATQRLHNGGYNCIAGQVLVISSDWDQKEAFLDQVRKALGRAPARPAFYPGSDSRVADAIAAYPDNCERLDHGRVLISGEENAEYLENTEFFAPVLGVVELPGTGLQYFSAAVEAANDDFVGTLGVNVIAHPSTIKKLGDAFETTLAGLRYGCIAVNAWTGFGFLTATASWGAFPGHTIEDVQSGIGVVHNALLLEKPERSVVRGPFRPSPRSLFHGEFSLSPKPPWFVTAGTAATTGRRLTAWAAKPSWAKVPGIVLSAMRG